MACELRACCRRGGSVLYSTPDSPRDRDRSGAELPLLSTLAQPPRPDEDVAFHEAAHAVAYHAFGGQVTLVTLAGHPHVECESDPADLRDRAVMIMAGPAGQDAWHRQQRTLFEDELAEYFARVDDVTFGNCDRCRACLVATVHANKSGHDRVEIFRAAERRAIEFVRLPSAKAAIRALASELMARQTIDGAEAHALCDRFIKFGALSHAEEDQGLAGR